MSQSKVALRVFREVEAERNRQIAKWGTEAHQRDREMSFAAYLRLKTVVAGEEFGEVARAVLEVDILDRLNLAHLYDECIQTAAVFVAMAEGVALEVES